MQRYDVYLIFFIVLNESILIMFERDVGTFLAFFPPKVVDNLDCPGVFLRSLTMRICLR
jgi:hypothetical protein